MFPQLDPTKAAQAQQISQLINGVNATNPMQGMMVRIMEPMLSNVFSSLLPGASPTLPPVNPVPTGWIRKSTK